MQREVHAVHSWATHGAGNRLVQAATHSLVLEGALLLGSPSCLTLGTLPSSSRDKEGQLIEHLFFFFFCQGRSNTQLRGLPAELTKTF